jgi:ABC-type transporter Mla subunit MlaD
MNPRRPVFLFVVGGILFFGVLIFSAGKRQGWFSASVRYSARFESGDGLYVGTPVSMSGLRAGSVGRVELGEDNRVLVEIRLQSKFASKIRKDSKAVLGRPFIIGERAISITPGSKESELLNEGDTITGEESLEITDMLSGGRLGPYFATFTKLLDQLRIVIEGDGTAQSVNLVQVYRQAYQSLRAIEQVALDIRVLRQDVFATPETKKLIGDLSRQTETLGRVLSASEKALPAMTTMSSDIGTVMPQLTKTLGETIFTLQALQRSFILSGGVSRLKDEQEAEKKQPARAPASTP